MKKYIVYSIAGLLLWSGHAHTVTQEGQQQWLRPEASVLSEAEHTSIMRNIKNLIETYECPKCVCVMPY